MIQPSPSKTPPVNYSLRHVKGGNPLWSMVAVSNPKGTSQYDVFCFGCRCVFPNSNTTRFSKRHLLGCSGWQNTVEISQLLKYCNNKLEVKKSKELSSSYEKTSSRKLLFPRAMRSKDFATAVAANGLPHQLVDDQYFRKALKTFATAHRQRQVPKDYLGPTRRKLSSDYLPAIADKVSALVRDKFLPSLLAYGAEISVDGYSTKTSPIHNIIVSRNGNSFYLGFIPLEGDTANAEHIAKVLDRAVYLLQTMISIYSTDPHLRPEILTGSPNLYMLALDGASVNSSAKDLFHSEVQNDAPLKPLFLLSHCFSHSLNLLLNDLNSEPWIQRIVSMVKVLLSVFKNQSRPAAWLKEAGGKVLRSYPVTRFCYVVLLVETILWNRKCLLKVVDKQEFISGIRNNSWLKVSEIIKF
ncbi:hypothetical protein GEMRC1_004465 [Eukaryota sp. GEM-RC1]